MRSYRGSVSVSQECGERLFAYARKNELSTSELVEQLLEPVLDGTQAIPPAVLQRPNAYADRQPVHVPPPTEERIELDKHAYIRNVLASISAAAPDAGLSTRIRFPVSRELADDIDAQIERRAMVDGKRATPEILFDDAINRMLDRLESIPASRTCALCAGEIQGGARQLPLGRNDALVTVCYTCDTEHPRKGRYSFDGGRSTDLHSTTGVLTAGRDGNGNKQTRSR